MCSDPIVLCMLLGPAIVQRKPLLAEGAAQSSMLFEHSSGKLLCAESMREGPSQMSRAERRSNRISSCRLTTVLLAVSLSAAVRREHEGMADGQAEEVP